MVDESTRKRPGGEAVSVAETRADRITHDTVTLLHTTFITPLGRAYLHGAGA